MRNPTRQKLGEAEHFLELMKEHLDDDIRFSYYFSAFLSAARSITFHLQKQYSSYANFSDWYYPYQEEMKDDKELKYLHELRVEEVHREPVVTGTTRTRSFTIDVIIGEPSAVTTETKKNTKPASAKIPPKVVKRFLPKFDRVNIIDFCEKQINKLEKIVKKCECTFK